jgi:hypothetical protein
MSRKTRQAGAVALAAMLLFTIVGANGSGARAEEFSAGARTGPMTPQAMTGDVQFVSHEVVQPLPGALQDDGTAISADSADTLADLVDDMPTDGEMSKDMSCLADAIYFEARGEPLKGQLAVGRVIINRAESGRFPSSYCGVVYQPGQFSFVHGGHIPQIDESAPAWRTAKAIARIAHEGLWDNPVKGALFFHAASVSPGWGLTRVAQVSHHVFYR